MDTTLEPNNQSTSPVDRPTISRLKGFYRHLKSAALGRVTLWFKRRLAE